GVLLRGSMDTEVTGICIDSRVVQPGDLFVPIIGERVDAHRFIPDVFAKGAAASFTSQFDSLPEEAKVLIGVNDTEEALQMLGAWYRRQFDIPVVGVTGSVGKTTTKEMISAALSAKLKVQKTPGNFNSLVGLPITVLGIEDCHQAAVIEMGISERGEMEKLSQIAVPQYGVITNIGVSHIGQLGSQENIRKEKANIIDSFGEGSVLFLCADDPLLYEMATGEEIDLDDRTREVLPQITVRTFGQRPDADYHAVQVQTRDDRTSFACVGPNGSCEVHLSVMGIHNVNNALAAIGIAEALGLTMEEAARGVGTYKAFRMRGEIHHVGSMKLIDDTYNASPDSMKSGIRMLTSLSDCEKTVAVLADVLELGEQSDALHESIGRFIAEETSLNCLVTVGKGGRHIARGAKEALPEGRDLEVHSFADKAEAIEFLKGMNLENCGVLVKGSRGMQMEEIVKTFIPA
ncbi:MAG: UDP-N-acetylmuramoyl-tripeptide--D-alanyl-D-alanine ligase, partial [Lachnospiraceae bacterium]|nr:UDP-N-acetylmuramoyl-tripeptide--D-alanyl-D-alanine ligase [Lachnospiraceae bacterium]